MSGRERNKRATGGNDGHRARSRSPHESDKSLTEDDLRRIVTESMKQQIPSLIVETSKVVSAQMSTEGQETAKSFTTFSQEMKLLKQRQEEVAYLSKAASLKSDGTQSWFSMVDILSIIFLFRFMENLYCLFSRIF